jgi:predicted DNA-binding antitoxin AbrB/MazE fold protein
MTENPSTTLPGTVEKIIKPVTSEEPEKAQIAIEGADHLYREIRIENTLTDESGQKVRLKPGAEVAVTVEAPKESTAPTGESSQC